MILLRGIKGDVYAHKINDCIIGFRDLLSTLLNTNYTGYTFSNYQEKYIIDMFKQIMIPPANLDDFSDTEIEKQLLIFNKVLPYFYISYFHILNEKSIDWLNEFDDDISLIYIEPKTDLISQNMIGKNFFGRKIEYVDNIMDSDFNDFITDTAGMLQFIDTSIESGVPIEMALKHVGAIANIMYTIFHRVINSKFTSIENEFRIIYQVPTTIKSNGEMVPEEERIFNITINGTCEYIGKVNIYRDKFNIRHCDMPLVTTNILTKRPTTSLIDEVLNGNTYKVESSFKDINLKNSITNYGYIGNKDDGLKFILERIKNPYSQ